MASSQDIENPRVLKIMAAIMAVRQSTKIEIDDIGDKFIKTTEGYIRINYGKIHQDVSNLILFFYAKPIVMKLFYESKHGSIKYCPIKDSWSTMIRKVDKAMDIKRSGYIKKFTILKYDGKRIYESDWYKFRWDEKKLFAVEAAWKDEMEEIWEERNRRRPTPPPGMSRSQWNPK